MKREILLASITFMAFLLFVGLLYGAYQVTSPPVTVTVEEYTLTLSSNATSCIIGQSIEFYGTLTLDGTPVVGQTVELFYNGSFATGLNDVTSSDGSYSIVWTATLKGTYNFQTGVPE